MTTAVPAEPGTTTTFRFGPRSLSPPFVLLAILLETASAAAFALLVLAVMSLRGWNEVYVPLLDVHAWEAENADGDYVKSDRMESEGTYYRRLCVEDDVTTADPLDLLIGSGMSSREAVDVQMRHGASIFPGVVHPDSASDMRDYIVGKNRNSLDEADPDYIGLIGQEHRWSFRLGMNEHPSIPPVMAQIASHPTLRSALDELVGDHPALMELTVITVGYGGSDQHWHKDVSDFTSQRLMARTFLPQYSIFIPLQDTTSEMGATDVCPGSHVCGDDDSLNEDVCAPNSVRVVTTAPGPKSGSNSSDAESDSRPLWKAGDALLFDMALNHRGPGHVDPSGPDRVMLILSITSRPRHDLPPPRSQCGCRSWRGRDVIDSMSMTRSGPDGSTCPGPR